ncbi:hypothetical protein EYF80_040747 [Liparis tanakae]|uniref:Uncharacterized protein n=1 Tax=Liparis tanakae TaxID=230148 RepID=A0A4Z2G6A3_9TELE|nr:hypothetical protein EYF80_040747 [Liparis tanakae]
MERKCREVQGSVMGGYLLCARSVADECVVPPVFGPAEEKELCGRCCLETLNCRLQSDKETGLRQERKLENLLDKKLFGYL